MNKPKSPGNKASRAKASKPAKPEVIDRLSSPEEDPPPSIVIRGRFGSLLSLARNFSLKRALGFFLNANPRQRKLIVASLLGIFTLWFVIGGIFSESTEPVDTNRTNQNIPEVQIQVIPDELISPEVTISGQTTPEREVVLKAEISGRVTSVLAEKGSRVLENQSILEIDKAAHYARYQQALASLRVQELNYRGVTELKSEGLASDGEEQQARAQLEAARAEAESMRVNYFATQVLSPFEGVLADRTVEVGDYVNVGGQLATVYDNQPMLVTGLLSEREVGRVELGDEVDVRLFSGEEYLAEVSYVSPQADEETRTFSVEARIKDGNSSAIKAGVSAELGFTGKPQTAKKVSPALLSFDDKGRLVVKTVENSRVSYAQVEVVRASSDAFWVSGIETQARIIVQGHGFVESGDLVEIALGRGRSTSNGTSP